MPGTCEIMIGTGMAEAEILLTCAKKRFDPNPTNPISGCHVEKKVYHDRNGYRLHSRRVCTYAARC